MSGVMEVVGDSKTGDFLPRPNGATSASGARAGKGITHITVRGARQHNLRNVSVSIPRNTLTVVTGLSGSGKSSLAFDTIYAEGQRRYVETLSAYARQFLDQMERPDVDAIDGLSPAISIEQKTTSRSPRSTVGTITEIYDYLRLLYASVGQPHCPNCARPISRQSAEQIVERIASLNPGERITVFAPIVRGRKGEFREELESLDQQGFRVRIDGEMVELTEGMRLEKRKNHTIEAVVDRIILKPLPVDAEALPETANAALAAGGGGLKPKYDTRRLEASVVKALQMANGLVLIGLQDPGTRVTEETLYSSSMACPDCGINVPKLEPRSFSFNSNYGACPECHGLGSIYDFDPGKTITDWSKPLMDGAMGPGSGSTYLLKLIKLAGEKYKIDLKKPFQELTETQRNLLLYGPPAGESGRTGFHGIFAYLRSNLEETKSEGYREYMMQYMSATNCPRCKGRRLRPESLAVTVNGQSIADFTGLSLERALTAARGMGFTGRDKLIADRLQREVIERLEFLNSVGLGYLSLDRSAATLSGGEGQRIRLATQIGSRLRGVLYVLDEPSIGLHQRDNQRLITALERLRDLGNTVLVVEHDEDTIRKADYVLDLGPGAGKNGGYLIADGTPAEIMANPASVTGQYLAGKIEIVTRPSRMVVGEDGAEYEDLGPRPLTGKWITVEDARSHNLQHVTAHFPLGVMTVVTGVSGSGKSTLVNDILYRSLAKELYGSREEPGQHGRVIGVDQLDKVIQIDQSAIGRTPRSNPATYTGVFTAMRDLFAMLPDSRERGYKPGRFSFNVQGGRCEACQGEGQRRIEMNFLPDVYVLCEVCNGRRYNQETLAVKFNGYSIADLLELSIADAVPILKDIPNVAVKLQTLVDVGLGYIHLGQSATTLSGGEAQRMKLARELSKRQTGRTLYLLDEPTTGLHFDDVRRLLDVLHRLTDLGNTVIIIEHNLDIIRNADYLLDMGPEGGEFGGTVIGHGTPEQLAGVEGSHTGYFLRQHFPGLKAKATGPNAGAQPDSIRAEADAMKGPKTKFVPNEKKTGVPTGKPSVAKPVSVKKAAKAAAKKAAKAAREEGEVMDGIEPAAQGVARPVRRVPNLLHFLLFVALTAFSLILAEAVGLTLVSGPIQARLGNARLQLGVELVGYCVTLAVAWFAFAAIWERAFLVGVRWNWAVVRPRLVLVGFGLGYLSQGVESLLPVPKHAPIEDLFRSPGIIWFLAGFGTLVAPLFEEVLFRGMLLPALAHAVDWMRLPKDLAALEVWRGAEGYSRGALVAASVVTSLVFAGIHAPQIGYTWSAVALLAGVSMVLCWIRLRYDSVAASTVVHGCYNLSVFVTIFIGTGGFRHLDKAG